MVTAGTLAVPSHVSDQFTSTVQTAAHNTIVYWDANRHTYSGVVAPTGEYSADNPSSGISAAGVGSAGTNMTASTVYNHLNAATYNLTHIRQSAANFYVQLDPTTTTSFQSTVGPSMTVRPTSVRQTVSGVANGGVAAGSLDYASSANNLCTNMYNQWAALSANRSDFNVIYCHTSCHTNCHTSRGRR